jgi:hypothetical protein
MNGRGYNFVPSPDKKEKKLKKILCFLVLAFICSNSFATEFLMGNPVSLTQTVTSLSSTYIVGSANSTTAWTFVRGSDQGAVRFFISEPSATYDLAYTFNPLTYTVGSDYSLWKKNSLPMERFLFVPGGFYVNVTFTTVYRGSTFSTTIYYEGQK